MASRGARRSGASNFRGEARERLQQGIAVQAIQHALPLALGRHQAGVSSTDRWREIAGALMPKRPASSAVESAVWERKAMIWRRGCEASALNTRP
jgi:hypothetical protein